MMLREEKRREHNRERKTTFRGENTKLATLSRVFISFIYLFICQLPYVKEKLFS